MAKAAVLTMFALCLSAGPLRAEVKTYIGPIYDSIVAMPIPDGFASAFEVAKDGFYIHEFVANGETVEAWTGMITVTGNKGFADRSGSPVIDYANRLSGGYQGGCPDSFGATALDPPRVPGATAVFAGHLSCGQISGADHGEAMVFVVVAGEHDVYTMQWAVRAPAGSPDLTVNGSPWGRNVGALAAGFRICPRIDGEEPPYPSCAD